MRENGLIFCLAKDNYRTPPKKLRRWKINNYFPLDQTIDMTIFEQQYNNHDNKDIFWSRFKNCYIFINPPFSITPEIFSMIIEAFKNGCNIMCLCLKTSTDGDYYKLHVSKLCDLQDKGSFPFVGYDKSMGRDCVLLKFFQADHAQYVYNMNKWTGKNF